MESNEKILHANTLATNLAKDMINSLFRDLVLHTNAVTYIHVVVQSLQIINNG